MSFADFNNATGNLTVVYTAGSLATPIQPVNSFSISFTPENLGTVIPDVPEVSSISNSDEETITVTFDKTLTGGTDIAEHLTVYCNRLDMCPDGTLFREVLAITSTEASGNNAIVINLADSMRGVIGDVGIIYDGLGGLEGSNGYVTAFDETFTPTGISWFTPPNDAEHVEFGFVSATATNTKIDYSDYTEPAEHVEFGFVSATAVLTYVGEL